MDRTLKVGTSESTLAPCALLLATIETKRAKTAAPVNAYRVLM